MEFNGGPINNMLMLAPMAGVTDLAFRAVCAEYGAEYTVTEMVSAKAVCFGDKKTAALARLYDGEKAAIQIFGSEPYYMAKAAEALLQYRPVAIDINMGCPVPKCVKSGEGSALMKDPALCGEIVAAVKAAVDIPVTVKMRTGFDAAHKNAVEVALRAEEAGAALICVHGRTREQMYTGKAETETIAAVKAAVGVPVIANGDITDGESAKRMLLSTGCDGIAVGRGALGRPWVFSEIAAALKGGEYKAPNNAEKYRTLCKHISSMAEIKGERGAILEARKHLAWYSKGLHGSAAVRRMANTVTTLKQALEVAKLIFPTEEE